MKSVDFDVKYEEKARRLELLIRWLWAIPSYIVLMVLEIILWVGLVLQFFHILILGKRNKTFADWTKMFVSYSVKFQSYFFLLTEERNPLMPES